jgi:hypothetical protein
MDIIEWILTEELLGFLYNKWDTNPLSSLSVTAYRLTESVKPKRSRNGEEEAS